MSDSESPLILLTNDDGLHADGLAALYEAVKDLGEVWVVAPASEQSAISHAITLWDPVRIKEYGPRRFSVTGTPTDCVYVALAHLLDRTPALCLSGINHGANLGDDVHYSGTVAGASEAALNDIPSVAISLASFRSREFQAAGRIARRLAESVLARGLPRGVLLNCNVPKDITGDERIHVTKLGRRNYGKQLVEKTDPRQRSYYWIGGSELGFDDLPGSDCNAIARTHVTVSPVQLDMTHYRFVREMDDWAELGALEVSAGIPETAE